MCSTCDLELQEPCPPEDNLGGHIPLKCGPQKDGHPAHSNSGAHCPFCEEEILACATCGGAEGSLPKQCPGVKISEDDQQLIYKGVLDFTRERRWHVRGWNSWETPDLHKEFEARAAAERLNNE